MEPHFIRDITFKNFKCFKELEVANIKRVNLIKSKNLVLSLMLMKLELKKG